MGLFDKILGWFIVPPEERNYRRASLSEQIENCKRAMLRREERMRELWKSIDHPRQCEHIAALGGCAGEYSKLADKQERSGAWLRVLLAKRGTDEDVSLAEAIRIGAWP